MTDFNTRKIVAILSIFIIAILGIIVNIKILNLWEYDPGGNDIYYTWLEGKRLLAGENPYARILAGNMRENDKYATYFPLFYLLSAITQWIGFRDYSTWLNLWRPIFLAFNIGIGLLIYYQFYQDRLLLLGLFSSFFWLFSRWTVHVTKIVHIEFIAIFILLLSLILLPRKTITSFILFGCSLAIKQVAIFLLPLYLIWAWQLAERNKLKEVITALFYIALIPSILSLPFILWNAEGFLKSILFSATRLPDSHIKAASLDALIQVSYPAFIGIKAKLPMLFLMSLIFLGSARRQIGIYTSVLLMMAIFINFNSVLFLQYFSWIVPFLPLVLCDQYINVTSKEAMMNYE
ncbi:MAG: hypothetical protein WBA13_10315 [Microcoleaceae cyanobacterium]